MRTAEQVRYLILAAQREGNRLLMTLLSELVLTPAQSEALRIIADHGPLALRDLGGMLVCDSGTSPSRLVDRLVAAGLVTRDGSTHDRRQIQLKVTPSGKEKADRVRAIEERIYESIDSTLDADDTEALLGALRALTQDSAARGAFEKRLAAE